MWRAAAQSLQPDQHTPFQRQIKLWAASGQWAEMLWLAGIL